MTQNTEQTLQTIAQRLKDRGERFTAPRQAAMRVLVDHGKAAKAYDILQMMGSDVKPMTVYRALDFFVAQGLVHRIESLNAYALCVEKHCFHRDSQYLICEKCEDITELHSHDIDNIIDKNLDAMGFVSSHRVLEIHGVCSRCA